LWPKNSFLLGKQFPTPNHYSTDEQGQEAVENIVIPEDFHATIGHAMGLPIDLVERSPTGRPSPSATASGPAITNAYVLCRSLEPRSKRRSREYVIKPDDAKLPGMRAPAQVSEDGFSVSATLPEGIPAFCFSIIDAKGHKQYSDVVKVK